MVQRHSRREFLKMSGVAAGGLALAACSTGTSSPAASAGASAGATPAGSAPAGGSINFLTWSDHFGEAELAAVKEQTGISVNISELADNIDGYNKLSQVKGQLDLVSGDALWVPHYNDAGLIEPIDINSFEVAKQLYSISRSFDFFTTPAGYLAYPWGWSPIQVVYNPKHVSPAPDSWEVMIDPKYAGKIVMENQPTDIMLFAGVATGAKDIYNMTDAELATATEWLKKLKPNVYKLVQQNNEQISALASEEAWIATNMLGAADRVKDAGGPEVVAMIPKEGTTGFIDGEMTVKEGANKALVKPYLEAAAQAEWVAQNFLDNGRPLWNEKAYQLLVDGGNKDKADRYLYNQPELALKMRLKGPAGNTDAYVSAFNSVFGG
jgi:spermidine/putrescine-binding protein